MAATFRIFGPVQATVDGQAIEVGPPKQRALLAVLLLERGALVPRSRLVDAVWGDAPPASAVSALQVYVHGLRRALGPDSVETQGDGYRIRLRPGELDLDRFERLAGEGVGALEAGDAAGAVASLRAALELAEEPPLADLRDGPLRHWASSLDGRVAAVLELLAEAELAVGAREEVLPLLEAAIVEHPFRERLREHQIVALYRAGRAADALTAYQAARRSLDEIGVEPGQGLRELERAVLRRDPSLDPPGRIAARPLRLPRVATSIVGRRLEVAAVAGLFRDEGVRLLTLTGPGGTGKTRLALAAAEVVASELGGGAAFVDLSGVTDAELLPLAIADALELESGAGPVVDTVVESLGARPLLLVLDNFEQIVEAAPTLPHLLAKAPGLRLLATSRVPLRVSGEQEYAVRPLALPAGAGLEAVAASDAVQLFVGRARSVDPAFVLDARTAPAVAEICVTLDGLPLAIELAAARTRLLAPAEIVPLLEGALDLLTDGARDAPPRQRTLRAALDWSYRLLGDPERELLARLALFAGGVTLASGAAVLGDDGTLLGRLGVLVESNLLRRVGVGRFDLLQTVRAYAFEALAASGELETLRGRHAEHFLALAESLDQRLHAVAVDHEAIADLHPERANLHAALDWFERNDLHRYARLAIALRPYWGFRGHVAEGRRAFEVVFARAGELEPGLRARVLAIGGYFPYRQGDVGRAKELWEEAFDLCVRLDDRDGLSRCTAELAAVAYAEGDLDRAVALYLESCALFEELDMPLRLGTVLANLAEIEVVRGELEAATAHGERAVELQRRLGDRDGLAGSLQNLARIRISRGELERAEAMVGEAVEVVRSVDLPEVVAYVLATAADLARRLGDLERAARLLGASESALAPTGIELQGLERAAFDETAALLAAADDGARLAAVRDEARATPPEAAFAAATRAATS